ncbi:MAG: hypothetical protein ABIH00_11720, partial [Armatimonadota bacterium]
MKIGITGFENSGKKTIFELLTGRQVDNSKYRGEKQLISASAQVLDPRFERVADIYNPKRRVRALIDFQLLQPFEKISSADKGIIQSLKNMDAVCFVVRQFKDDSIYHIDGSIDACRDIEWFTGELMLHDMMLMETRLKNIEEDIKKKASREKDAEKNLLVKMKEHLESGLPLRTLSFSEEEEKIFSTYQFLTDKCLIVIINTGEEEINDKTLMNKVKDKFKDQDIFIHCLSAKLEKELTSLSGEDKGIFLEEYGISCSALEALTRISYKALGLIT